MSLLRKTNLKIVDAVTINEITTNKERAIFYRNVLKTNIETMEGAALHYVCLMEKIPFLQLRSVSNYVGEREKLKWTIRESIAQLNMDMKKLSDIVQAIIIERFDHKNLNLDTEEFKTLNPTAENIAIVIFNLLRSNINPAFDLHIRLYETPRNFVEYPV